MPSTSNSTDEEHIVQTATGPRTDLDQFVERCHAALTLQSQGHPETFLALWSHADDVSIMAAVGGYHLGFEAVNSLLVAASKTQSFDGWSADNLATVVNDDLAMTVELEHYDRRKVGEPPLHLRATQMYRWEGGAWRIIHRHGDVLEDISAKW